MRKLTPRETRLLCYLAVLLVVVGWDTRRRHWSPGVTKETDHYVVYSSATKRQTAEIALVAEILHRGYAEFFDKLGIPLGAHPKLKMKLFKDRDEFRRCNGIRDWAEAFYSKPYCCQYYSAGEPNPYHWMTHEAVHQLNEEVSRFNVRLWLNEGLADYFGTSRIVSNRLATGSIDSNTYPVWWLDKLIAKTGELEADKQNGSIIPLRAIISGSGGPDMDQTFNLYYLHWWTLTRFLVEHDNGKYRPGLAALLKTRADVPDVEKCIGPIDTIEPLWYAYVLRLKKQLAETPWCPPPQVILDHGK